MRELWTCMLWLWASWWRAKAWLKAARRPWASSAALTASLMSLRAKRGFSAICEARERGGGFEVGGGERRD